MKVIYTLFAILIVSWTSFSQANEVAGNYKKTIKTEDNNLFEWELTLLHDGAFVFHYYSNIKMEIPGEKNIYGKGKWTVKDNVVSFFSDKKSDLNEKYTLDFTNSKARFITKPPRDKTDRIIKTRLRFLESDIFWMKTAEIFKI